MTSVNNSTCLDLFCQVKGIQAVVRKSYKEEPSCIPASRAAAADDNLPSSKSFKAAANLSSFQFIRKHLQG
jgi:hypothetical protein